MYIFQSLFIGDVMKRINPDMPISTIVDIMSDGVPSVDMILYTVYERNAVIDPQTLYKSLDAITFMDEKGIYGKDVWDLYRYVCEESVPKMIMTMRAVQLGIIPMFHVRKAMRRDMRLNFDDMEFEVCAKLNAFKLNAL